MKDIEGGSLITDVIRESTKIVMWMAKYVFRIGISRPIYALPSFHHACLVAVLLYPQITTL